MGWRGLVEWLFFGVARPAPPSATIAAVTAHATMEVFPVGFRVLTVPWVYGALALLPTGTLALDMEPEPTIGLDLGSTDALPLDMGGYG